MWSGSQGPPCDLHNTARISRLPVLLSTKRPPRQRLHSGLLSSKTTLVRTTGASSAKSAGGRSQEELLPHYRLVDTARQEQELSLVQFRVDCSTNFAFGKRREPQHGYGLA